MFDLKKCRRDIYHDIEDWCKIWRKTDLWFGKRREEYGKFSPEHLKVSKLRLWWDPFFQIRKCMSLKFTEELCVTRMKTDAKFEEESTCLSKLTWGIWRILTQVLESLKTFHFNALLLIKVDIVWAKKAQRSYLSWHWRVLQKLERNRLVVSKLAWGVWQILTWALESLKNFHFNGLLLSKVYIVWPKKVQRSYLSWHWRVMQNLKKNWLVVWKMTWGIWLIFTRALESFKIGTLMGSFCPK